MLNSYLELVKDPTTGQFHPVLAGFEDAVRIIDGINRVVVTPTGTSIAPSLKLVPSYPDLPMESVYPRAVANPEPGIYLREVGKGRVGVFPCGYRCDLLGFAPARPCEAAQERDRVGHE